MHTLQKGPALKSYGLHVAELAGVPAGLIQRAAMLLKNLEGKEASKKQLSLMDWQTSAQDEEVFEKEVSLPTEMNQWMDQLKNFSVTEKTPLEALNQIAEWQKSCRDLS